MTLKLTRRAMLNIKICRFIILILWIIALIPFDLYSHDDLPMRTIYFANKERTLTVPISQIQSFFTITLDSCTLHMEPTDVLIIFGKFYVHFRIWMILRSLCLVILQHLIQ